MITKRRPIIGTKFLFGLFWLGVAVIAGVYVVVIGFIILMLIWSDHDFIVDNIMLLVIVLIMGWAIFVSLRRIARNFFKKLKEQRSVLEIGNDGYAEFVSKEE